MTAIDNIQFVLLCVCIFRDQTAGFNTEVQQASFLSPVSQRSIQPQDSNFFGYSFSFHQHGGNFNYIVGSPKSNVNSGDGEVLRLIQPQSPVPGSGSVHSCEVSKSNILPKHLSCSSPSPSIPVSSNPSEKLKGFGQSVNSFPDGSILSCSPSEELFCESTVFTPGFCYQSFDFGKIWQSTTKKHECPTIKLDLMFLLDGSGSVTFRNFEKVKEWTKKLAAYFFGPQWFSKLGVVEYSSYIRTRGMQKQEYVKTEIALGKHTNLDDFQLAVDKIRFYRGRTDTAHALNKTVADFQSSSRFRDPDTSKVLILLTDGQSSDKSYVKYSAAYMRSLGVKIFSVGVGKSIKMDELKLIANGGLSDDSVFTVADFSALDTIAKTLEEKVYKLSLEGKSSSHSAATEMESAELGFSVAKTPQPH